jgi:hypothetical protein
VTSRRGRVEEAERLVSDAREGFERLAATPWIERAAQTSDVAGEPESVLARS